MRFAQIWDFRWKSEGVGGLSAINRQLLILVIHTILQFIRRQDCSHDADTTRPDSTQLNFSLSLHMHSYNDEFSPCLV